MLKDKLKFASQVKPDFIIELREKIKEYFETKHISKFGNANLVVKTIFMFLVYLLPFILMLSGTIHSFPGILFCWILMGVGMAGVGMGLMHDANHGTYSKNKSVNTLFSYSLYLLGGLPATWQYQHNTLHHGFTNIDGYDEDIDPIPLLRFSPHKPLLKVHKYQYLYAWFFYGLMTLSWTITKDFKQLYSFRKMDADVKRNNTFNQLYVKLIVSKIIYYAVFLVLPLILIQASWYWIILSYLAMHFTSGLILSTIFQTAHVVPSSEYPLPDKNGNLENNWAIHQLLTTSDFAPKSRVLSWFIGGLNFQIEHHLFPNISHVHYRNISHLVKETAMKYELPYHVEPTFLLAIAKHAQMLKVLGKQTL